MHQKKNYESSLPPAQYFKEKKEFSLKKKDTENSVSQKTSNNQKSNHYLNKINEYF